MSAMGQKQAFAVQNGMSALCQKRHREQQSAQTERLSRGGPMVSIGQAKPVPDDNPEQTFCGNRIRPLRYVKGLSEQPRYTGLRNVCSMAIAKIQQEYTMAQARRRTLACNSHRECARRW